MSQAGSCGGFFSNSMNIISSLHTTRPRSRRVRRQKGKWPSHAQRTRRRSRRNSLLRICGRNFAVFVGVIRTPVPLPVGVHWSYNGLVCCFVFVGSSHAVKGQKLIRSCIRLMFDCFCVSFVIVFVACSCTVLHRLCCMTMLLAQHGAYCLIHRANVNCILPFVSSCISDWIEIEVVMFV